MLGRRFYPLLLALSLFIPLLAMSQGAAAKPVVIATSFVNPVGASLYLTTTTGCLDTQVILSAFRTVQQKPPGTPQSDTGWIVFLDKTDHCTQTQLLRAGNDQTLATVPDARLDIGNDLRSARFTATLVMTDELTGSTFNAAIDVTWTCPHQAIPVNSIFMEHKGEVGDYIVSTHTQSRENDGCPVSGSIVDTSSGFQFLTTNSTSVIDTSLIAQKNGSIEIYFSEN